MTPRRSRPSRKPNLLDAMIFVAAMAVWIYATKIYAERSNLRSIWYPWDYGLPRIVQNQVGFLLMTLSATMLVIRLRGPRPPRRRLWRQPGFAASVGACLGMAAASIKQLLRYFASTPNDFPTNFIPQMLTILRPYAAPGVIGAWLALRMTGRWKSERGSIDRLGRLVGFLWLVEFLIAEMPTNRWIIIIDRIITRGFK